MNTLLVIRTRLLDRLKRLSALPSLLARLTLGLVFVESGWGKLGNLERVAGFFASLGLPAPAFQAHLVAFSEFGFGILVLAGLCTRLAALPLSAIMVVAIVTARSEELSGFWGGLSALAGFTEFLYLLLLVWLIVAGPGALSLDRLFFKNEKSL